MATRSGIGIEREDGSVVGVYCHWDGYPEGVGKTLQEHYLDPQKAETLIGLGSISSLDADIGERHPFGERRDGWTTFYGRDRGEPGAEPLTYANREEFRAGLRRSGAEFLYVFATGGSGREGAWEVSKPCGRWRSLGDVLVRGVDLLVEPDPDRGADILVERDEGTALLSGVTAAGRSWVNWAFDDDTDADGAVGLDADEAATTIERAKRDGLIVEDGRILGGPDLVVERHVFEGSPVLALRAMTADGARWMVRNRHPSVPGEMKSLPGDLGCYLCHPKTLPMILAARRERLVVQVENLEEDCQ